MSTKQVIKEFLKLKCIEAGEALATFAMGLLIASFVGSVIVLALGGIAWVIGWLATVTGIAQHYMMDSIIVNKEYTVIGGFSALYGAMFFAVAFVVIGLFWEGSRETYCFLRKNWEQAKSNVAARNKA